MIANLISIIVGIVFIAFFAGFNLDNKCDVSLVFYTFRQIPVFFTILVSFAVGMLCSLPFALVHRTKKSKAQKEPKIKKNSAEKKNPEKNEKAEKPESAGTSGEKLSGADEISSQQNPGSN